MIGNSRTPRVLIQARDQQIFTFLRDIRIATRQQIQAFCGFGSSSRANSRLSQLVVSKHLGHDFVGTISGGRSAVYFLPGHAPAAHRGPAGLVAASSHGLAITDTYLSLHNSATPNGIDISWRRPAVPLGGARILPDAVFTLSKNALKRVCFLEQDRGSEGTSVWKSKVQKYLALARDPSLPDLINSDRFRVLVVCASKAQLDRIRSSVLEQVETIFWFTTSQSIKEHGFFGPIWKRPSAEANRALFGGL